MVEGNGAAVEVFVEAETDLTSPLTYFASRKNPRGLDPPLLRTTKIEELVDL